MFKSTHRNFAMFVILVTVSCVYRTHIAEAGAIQEKLFTIVMLFSIFPAIYAMNLLIFGKESNSWLADGWAKMPPVGKIGMVLLVPAAFWFAMLLIEQGASADPVAFGKARLMEMGITFLTFILSALLIFVAWISRPTPPVQING